MSNTFVTISDVFDIVQQWNAEERKLIEAMDALPKTSAWRAAAEEAEAKAAAAAMAMTSERKKSKMAAQRSEGMPSLPGRDAAKGNNENDRDENDNGPLMPRNSTDPLNQTASPAASSSPLLAFDGDEDRNSFRNADAAPSQEIYQRRTSAYIYDVTNEANAMTTSNGNTTATALPFADEASQRRKAALSAADAYEALVARHDEHFNSRQAQQIAQLKAMGHVASQQKATRGR